MERLRLRKYLPFKPVWEGPIEGWTIKFLKKSICRVMPVCDFEDLLQDARWFFVVCERKYVVDNPRHFMALYKTCLVNHINRLSNTRTKKGKVLGYGAEDAKLDLLSGVDLGVNQRATLESTDAIEHASKRIVKLLTKMSIIESPRKYLTQKRPWFRDLNTWLCDLAEVPKTCDMVGEVKEWASGELRPT